MSQNCQKCHKIVKNDTKFSKMSQTCQKCHKMFTKFSKMSQNCGISWQYLESPWEMHSNKYKHVLYWFIIICEIHVRITEIWESKTDFRSVKPMPAFEVLKSNTKRDDEMKSTWFTKQTMLLIINLTRRVTDQEMKDWFSRPGFLTQGTSYCQTK